MADSKIVIVIGSLGLGGTERQLLMVLPELLRSGLPVRVHTMIGAGDLAPELEAAGVEVYAPLKRVACLRRGRLGKALLLVVSAVALMRHLLDKRTLFVHCYLPQAYLMTGVCSMLVRFKHLVMSRRSLNHYQLNHSLLAKLEHRLHRDAVVGVANSKAIIEELREEGFPSSRLAIIPNGIAADCEGSGEVSRSSLGISAAAIVFINVANLIPYKGHIDLIEGFAKARSKARDRQLCLLCVGRDEGLLAELKTWSAKLGCAEDVIFVNQVSDVRDYLNIADVGVSASHQEGFSNAILEYMRAGLPVLATAVGGALEQVEEAVSGTLVPTRNPVRLGAAMLQLIESAELRQRWGDAGRQRVVTKYPLDSTVEKTAVLYLALWLKRLAFEPRAKTPLEREDEWYPAILDREIRAVMEISTDEFEQRLPRDFLAALTTTRGTLMSQYG
ncbi:MAG: glycosyltransferase [Pseudomonadota bacterium]